MTDFHLGSIPAEPKTALTGRGILITRPMWQAVPLAQKLGALGAVPFIFPAIVITKNAALDLPAAQRRLASCTKAFFVSANAVREGLMGLTSFPSNVMAYGPGPGTAEALNTCGAKNVCIPNTTYDSAGLLALPELQSLNGERVMIFTGANGKGDLAVALRSRGATVEIIECYQRDKPATDASGLDEAWAQGRIHASILTSNEGIENFWQCLSAIGKQNFCATPAFVPHQNVASFAKSKRLISVTNCGPGDDALLAALLARFTGV